MTTLWSGSIPVDAIDIVETRVERIAKRAERHGFPVPTATFGARKFVSMDGEPTSVEWVDLSIDAEGALRLGNYEFVGTIAALEDGFPFVTYAPGVIRPDFTVTHPRACDHCQSNRNRTDTYLVRNRETGEVKQVGSSCIKDFTGHDPAAIVGWLSAIETLSFDEDEIGGWGRSATRFYPPAVIIDIASRIVSHAGYISKQKALDEDKTPTADLVRAWLTARGRDLKEFETDYPDDEMSAGLYLKTMQAIESKVDEPVSSDWLADIIRLSSVKGVQWRHVGILASAVVLGLRESERKAVEGKGESHFIGVEGERLSFTDVTVTMKRGYENAYGGGFVVRMNVNESDDLLWFATWSEKVNALNEGDVINLVATVKAHEIDSRSGRKTTVLTRCSIKE